MSEKEAAALGRGEPDEPLGPPCPDKTRLDLEWDELLEALARRTRGEAGRQAALALPFLGSRAAVRAALTEIEEVRQLGRDETPLPRAALPDLTAAVGRARLGSTLAAAELAKLGEAIAHARELSRFLRIHRDAVPELARALDLELLGGAEARPLFELGLRLAESFEPDQTLADTASPELADKRAAERQVRKRIVARLEELVGRQRELLSDGFWTERDGRFVLPVRSDAHERVAGIVHGTSAGGSTLFVEPKSIVDLGNQQVALRGAVRVIEERILAELSAAVGALAPLVTRALAALAHADLRGACAALADELELAPPEHLEDRVDLCRLRHPLLVLRGVEVVPCDVSLRMGQALVVSGPNAGGKTVVLKALGLCALAVRAGLPVPAARGASMALFARVLTDVGDEQSLARNLSTFSAHVQNVAGILAESRRGVLVLLDEIAGGTDPREGEALGQAVLESLVERGAMVVSTTHYDGLKLAATDDDRFVNASVGFDPETLSPTFQLTLGVPGASSALAVARRFGVPPRVLEAAERRLGDESRSVAHAIALFERQRAELASAEESARREARALAATREDIEAERERERERDRRLVGRESSELLGEVRTARRELADATERLRQMRRGERQATEGELRDAERAIDRAARPVTIGGAVAKASAGTSAPARVAVGSRVLVPRLGIEGEVVELLGSSQVRIAAGPLKVIARVDELAEARGKQRPMTKARAARQQFDAASDPEDPLLTSENTVDLRGLRADEVFDAAEAFFDRCQATGLRVAFVIHGHGTGALRDTLRADLGKSPYVARFRPGKTGEGGDGVTVVWLC